MKKMPDGVIKAWENRKSPIVFSTVDSKGIPNSIFASCVSKYNDGTVVVADNYFEKTKKNILSGSTGSILFITSEDKSYQLKGPIKYYTDGEIFDDMKKWNPKEHPGNGAAALEIEEIYSGSKKIV
jgi:uncharacterized protein